MSEDKEEKKITPPYLPYKTFTNFIERLKVGVPARIDRSVMGTFSGAAQAALFSALRFFSLISKEHLPTEALTKLVNSTGDERKTFLKVLMAERYPFLFKAGIDFQRMTAHQLQETFENSGASGGTIQKSIAFFMAMAKDAGIELSPHLKIKGTGRKVGKARKSTERYEKHDNGLSQNEGQHKKENDSFAELQLWLSMFPKFDPAWPDDIKSKWFDDFRDLRKDFKQKKDDNKEGEKE